VSYRTIQPPFTLRYREMSKPDLRAYYDWFMQVRPERIAELEAAVREAPSHSAWAADGSRGSLSLLGQWFVGQGETRPRTPEEIKAIRLQSSFPIDIPANELTNRTFSLAIDIGMYLGKVVETNVAGVSWDQPLKDKKFVDYGQPVIVGLGPVPFNPVRVVITTAYGIADKQYTGEALLEVYDIRTAKK
jgi:hypothetical protein